VSGLSSLASDTEGGATLPWLGATDATGGVTLSWLASDLKAVFKKIYRLLTPAYHGSTNSRHPSQFQCERGDLGQYREGVVGVGAEQAGDYVRDGVDLADEAPVEGVLAARDPLVVRLLRLRWRLSVGSGGASSWAPVARLRGLRWHVSFGSGYGDGGGDRLGFAVAMGRGANRYRGEDYPWRIQH
jgi:hypothetical protein